MPDWEKLNGLADDAAAVDAVDGAAPNNPPPLPPLKRPPVELDAEDPAKKGLGLAVLGVDALGAAGPLLLAPGVRPKMAAAVAEGPWDAGEEAGVAVNVKVLLGLAAALEKEKRVALDAAVKGLVAT